MRNIILPYRSEFGIKLLYHVPAVHRLIVKGPKVVIIEEGEEALYPSADEWMTVERKKDSKRRNGYRDDVEFIHALQARVLERYGAEAFRELKPDATYPRQYFVPEPYVAQLEHESDREKTFDVVLCPRRREYGSGKNWPHWEAMTKRLLDSGVRVFSGGAADSSYDVEGPRAWDYPRELDATIEAMLHARLVVATDAGLAHLAMLCGVPLLLITHGPGLVAPGPVMNEDGQVFEKAYWPVKLERYRMANHRNVPITVFHHGWEDPERVLKAIKAGVSYAQAADH